MNEELERSRTRDHESDDNIVNICATFVKTMTKYTNNYFEAKTDSERNAWYLEIIRESNLQNSRSQGGREVYITFPMFVRDETDIFISGFRESIDKMNLLIVKYWSTDRVFRSDMVEEILSIMGGLG